jgi:hypothetical protein
VKATRHEQPCPCTVAFCSPLVPRCDQPANVPRPPKVSRSMFRCSGSSHRAEWFDAALKEMLRLAPSQESQVAAKRPGGHEPRQPLHFVPAVVTPHARPPEDKKCSAAGKARRRRRALPAAEGSVYEPPAALIAAWLERVRLSRERKPTQARVASVCRLRRNHPNGVGPHY